MNLRRIALWWKAFRFHYATASFMPGILGSIIAWQSRAEFHAVYFLLVILGLVLNHCALNMTDDYYDFRHQIDLFDPDGNPYTGGSGTLSSGLIRPEEMRCVFTIFYGIAIGIGLFLGFMRGSFIILLMAFGFFCAYFYTAPPVRFGYHGLGEIAQLLCFGPGIGLGAYYVQTQRISWEAFWGTLPFGIMLFSMITINEIPDYLEDRKGGKLNLVARFGRRAGVRLFTASLLSAYGALLIGILLRKIPLLGLMSLATFPIALRAIRLVSLYSEDPVKLAPANLAMICTHNFTAILLILAYFIHGFRPDAILPSFLPLVILAVLYFPVVNLIRGSFSVKKVHVSVTA